MATVPANRQGQAEAGRQGSCPPDLTRPAERPLVPRQVPHEKWAEPARKNSLLEMIDDSPEMRTTSACRNWWTPRRASRPEVRLQGRHRQRALRAGLRRTHRARRLPRGRRLPSGLCVLCDELNEVGAALSFITNSPEGVNKIVEYAVQSAARTYLRKNSKCPPRR